MGGTYTENPSTPITRGDTKVNWPYAQPYDIQFKPCYGWTRPITLLDDHRLFKRLPQFAGWTKADHLRESSYAMVTCQTLELARATLVELALKLYGDHGSLVSGCIRDHFPSEVQDTLRQLAHRASRESRRSYVHWKAAGKTAVTWRRL